MHFSRFPRIRFAHLPTPLEPMRRLSEHLGGPRLWIKRDDCTGLSSGGNKTRKLEFLLADALAQGADTVITQGATQSNHARQTAAAAARLGLACHLLLQDRTGIKTDDYVRNGNVALDRLHGAVLGFRGGNADMDAEMAALADDLRAKGKRPYIIPGGGSNPIGALGYANAALELVAQANDLGLKIHEVVHATGSAGTQAGLVAGLAILHSNIPVMGISVRAPKAAQEDAVFALAQRVERHMGLDGIIQRSHIAADSGYVGEGYGLPAAGTLAAVKLVAQLEGIVLDPVYTGKAMDGLIDLVRKGRYPKDSYVVFIHTGGSAAVFAYRENFEKSAEH